jgi:hypothetical protein
VLPAVSMDCDIVAAVLVVPEPINDDDDDDDDDADGDDGVAFIFGGLSNIYSLEA